MEESISPESANSYKIMIDLLDKDIKLIVEKEKIQKQPVFNFESEVIKMIQKFTEQIEEDKFIIKSRLVTRLTTPNTPINEVQKE